MDERLSRRARGPRRTLIALVALVVALPATRCVPVRVEPRPSAPTGPSLPADADACPGTVGQELLERINEIRTEHGLGAMAPHGLLVQAAQLHTQDQARRNSISHYGADGSTSGQRVTRAGYRWSMVAENVGAGYADPRAVIDGWMTSPPHRSTILAPEPHHAGVGYVYRADSQLRHFWTLNVARPADPAADGTAACHP